ncbi:hypothetical protein RCL1_005264 [Eukaryota sp. TZLM3-RCL]
MNSVSDLLLKIPSETVNSLLLLPDETLLIALQNSHPSFTTKDLQDFKRLARKPKKTLARTVAPTSHVEKKTTEKKLDYVKPVYSTLQQLPSVRPRYIYIADTLDKFAIEKEPDLEKITCLGVKLFRPMYETPNAVPVMVCLSCIPTQSRGFRPARPVAFANSFDICVCESRDDHRNQCGLPCIKCEICLCSKCSCRVGLFLDKQFSTPHTLVEHVFLPVLEGFMLDEIDIQQLLYCGNLLWYPELVSNSPKLKRPLVVNSVAGLLRCMDESPFFNYIPCENVGILRLNDSSEDNPVSNEILGRNLSFVEPDSYVLHITLSFNPRTVIATGEQCNCRGNCKQCGHGICSKCDCRVIIEGEEPENNKLWFIVRALLPMGINIYSTTEYIQKQGARLKIYK